MQPAKPLAASKKAALQSVILAANVSSSDLDPVFVEREALGQHVPHAKHSLRRRPQRHTISDWRRNRGTRLDRCSGHPPHDDPIPDHDGAWRECSCDVAVSIGAPPGNVCAPKLVHESRTWPDRAFDRSGSPQRLHLDLHPLSGVPGNVRIGGHNGGQRLPYMVNLARGEERPAEGQEVWRHAVVDHAARSVRNVVCSKDRQHARQVAGRAR